MNIKDYKKTAKIMQTYLDLFSLDYSEGALIKLLEAIVLTIGKEKRNMRLAFYFACEHQLSFIPFDNKRYKNKGHIEGFYRKCCVLTKEHLKTQDINDFSYMLKKLYK